MTYTILSKTKGERERSILWVGQTRLRVCLSVACAHCASFLSSRSQIDAIEVNITSAHDRTEEGLTQIKKADKMQKGCCIVM